MTLAPSSWLASGPSLVLSGLHFSHVHWFVRVGGLPLVGGPSSRDSMSCTGELRGLERVLQTLCASVSLSVKGTRQCALQTVAEQSK